MLKTQPANTCSYPAGIYIYLPIQLAILLFFFFFENDVKSITFFTLMAFFASVFFSIETKSETNQKQGQNRIEISKSFQTILKIYQLKFEFNSIFFMKPNTQKQLHVVNFFIDIINRQIEKRQKPPPLDNLIKTCFNTYFSGRIHVQSPQ